MPEYTPTTEQVRSHYVFDQTDKWSLERGAAFDRWLAAHDADVAAKALEDVYLEIRENGHPSSGAAFIVNQRIHALRASTGGENA